MADMRTSIGDQGVGGVDWIPDPSMMHGDLSMNLPLIAILFLAKVGMQDQEDKTKKLMLIAEDMQSYETDMINLGQILSQLETTDPTDTKKIGDLTTQLKDLYAKMYGNSTPDHIDPHSDFGKWANAVTEKHAILFPKEKDWDISKDTSFASNLATFKDLYGGQDATVQHTKSGKTTYTNRFNHGLGYLLEMLSEGKGGAIWDAKDKTHISFDEAVKDIVTDLAADYQTSQNPPTDDKGNKKAAPTSKLGEYYSSTSSSQQINSGLGNAMTQLIQEGQTTIKSLGDTGHAMNSNSSTLFATFVNGQKAQ